MSDEIIEVVTEDDEREMLRRYRAARARMREPDCANLPVPVDDFSLAVNEGLSNQGQLVYDQEGNVVPGGNDEIMRALIVGLGGAVGSEVTDSTLGAGVGAGIASIIFDKFLKGCK